MPYTPALPTAGFDMRSIPSLILLGLLAACGQTGALYLPDEGISTPVEIRPGPQAAPTATPPAEAGAQATPDAPEDEEPVTQE